METARTERPVWDIERKLRALLGADVRVAARAFAPVGGAGGNAARLHPVRDLFLPDNSQPAGLPVFFEGRLRHFQRQIGVVFVWLEAPASPDTATEGPVYFRGKTAVILRGPAVVELAVPFQVEPLPADPDNYWRDLRLPGAQFEFAFAAEVEKRWENARRAPSAASLQVSTGAPSLAGQRTAPERRLDRVDSPAPSAVDGTHGDNAVKGEGCRPAPGPRPTPIRNLNCSPSTH
jgi:hypothetical protein